MALSPLEVQGEVAGGELVEAAPKAGDAAGKMGADEQIFEADIEEAGVVREVTSGEVEVAGMAIEANLSILEVAMIEMEEILMMEMRTATMVMRMDKIKRGDGSPRKAGRRIMMQRGLKRRVKEMEEDFLEVDFHEGDFKVEGEEVQVADGNLREAGKISTRISGKIMERMEMIVIGSRETFRISMMKETKVIRCMSC